MIVALISALTGLASGVVPEIIKEVRDTRSQQREIEFLKLQHTLQMERERVGAENKIREAEAANYVAELEAHKAAMLAAIEAGAAPSASPWLNNFNAFIRPATALMMILLFGWTSVVFMSGVMDAWAAGKISGEMQLAQVVWGSLLGEAIQAVLGYLFGYRAAIKRGAS